MSQGGAAPSRAKPSFLGANAKFFRGQKPAAKITKKYLLNAKNGNSDFC